MFVAKKILSQLLSPLSVIVLLALAGLWLISRRDSRRLGLGRLLLATSLLFLVGVSYGSSDWLMKPLEQRYASYVPSAGDSIEFVVVLGAGHTADPKLPITSQLNPTAVVRLCEGVRVQRLHPGSKLVLSGGREDDEFPHAEMMAKLARALGVRDEEIVVATGSRDTVGEARALKPVLGDAPFVLVTSASHMPRSMAIFRRVGLDPIPAPTAHHVKASGGMGPGTFFPGALAIRKTELAIHEYLGLVWAWIRGQI